VPSAGDIPNVHQHLPQVQQRAARAWQDAP
jgi:hypothetical protein